MNEFKVGDLITSKNFPSSLYEITGIEDSSSRYFVKTIVNWDGTLVQTEDPQGLYSYYENAIVPSFETTLRYEKLKREGRL